MWRAGYVNSSSLPVRQQEVLFSMCWESSRLPGILNVSLSCLVDLGEGRSSDWFYHQVDGLLICLWAFVCLYAQGVLIIGAQNEDAGSEPVSS